MPYCCDRFFTPNGLRNHLDNSANHRNEIECGWCNERWPTHLGKLRLQHEQEEHWLRCDECTYIFSDQDALQEHKDDDHDPSYCYGCKRKFMSIHNLNQHLRSSVHVGKNVKCPWCPNKFTNLTGVCHHLESGSCESGIDRRKVDQYCREVDPNHVFTSKQIGWHGSDSDDDPSSGALASGAAWDGSCFRCYFCGKGFHTLRSLNQHLGSPAHRQKVYHCPRCRREFNVLSGLVNHLENESCGAFRFQQRAGGFAFVDQLKLGGY